MISLESIGNAAVKTFRSNAPIDSGNLRNKATNGKLIAENVYAIRVDAKIAPYAKYTQVPWNETSPLIWRSVKHPEWNGKHHSFLYFHDGWTPTTAKQNPNEGWIDRGVKAVAEKIAEITKGEIV